MDISALIRKYESEPLDILETKIADDMKLAALSYRSYIEMLFYMEHTKRYKQSPGFERSTFNDYLEHRFNLAPSRYYNARKIYVQYPDEAEWLGVHFLQKVQRECGVEAIQPVVEELAKIDKMRETPITVADKDKIVKKYKKPPTKKSMKSALYWRQKYNEVKKQLEIALKEIDEKDEQIDKLQTTVAMLKAKLKREGLNGEFRPPACV